MDNTRPIADSTGQEPPEPIRARPSPTGRNFAAGMTGGVGYVHDPQEHFPINCNQETVDLEPVEDPADRDELRRLIEQHRQYTGSDAADAVLDTWESSVESFHKVVPHDTQQERGD